MRKLTILFAALMLCGQQMFADELSTLTVLSSDSTMGIGYGSGKWKDKMAWTDIYAIPQKGYYFAGWDDDNMDNPRHICVDEVEKVVTAFFAEVDCDEDEDIDIPADELSFMVDSIIYQVTSGETVEVVKNNRSYSGEIKLPASVTYEGGTYSVTSIGRGAFYRCTGLISVEIPASVSAIGTVAFGWCANLKSVTFAPGSQLRKIGEQAFQESGLTSIEIPADVTMIEERTFYFCKALTSVTFAPGSQLAIIDKMAFFRCEKLTSIEIPASVVMIINRAFVRCSCLSSVTFASGSRLSLIGVGAFNSCPKLEAITIPEHVSKIEEQAFGQTGLSSVIFTSNACQHAIVNNAFYTIGSNEPASLTLPDSWAEENRPIDNQTPWHGGYFNTTIIKLEPYKTEAKAAITQAAGDYSGSEALQEVVNYYLTAIDNANSIDAINALKEEALEALPAYLATYKDGKAAAKAELPTDDEDAKGAVVVITKGEKTLKLVNPDAVEYDKQE